MNQFFNSGKPFEIASNITGGHELTNDLVNFVYIVMYEYDKPIENYTKFFTRLAHNQWNWCDSEFNKLYKPPFNELDDSVSFNQEDNEENEYRKFLRDYLESKPNDITEWYKKEIAKLFVQGMTYREIQSGTKINLRYISETIKQFINDVNYNFHSRSIRNGYADSPPTEH